MINDTPESGADSLGLNPITFFLFSGKPYEICKLKTLQGRLDGVEKYAKTIYTHWRI